MSTTGTTVCSCKTLSRFTSKIYERHVVSMCQEIEDGYVCVCAHAYLYVRVCVVKPQKMKSPFNNNNNDDDDDENLHHF